MKSSVRAILSLFILKSIMIYETWTQPTPAISMDIKIESDRRTLISVNPKLINGKKLLSAQCKTEGVYTGYFLPDIVCKIAIQSLPILGPLEPTKECKVGLAEDVLEKSDRGMLVEFQLTKKFELEYLGKDKVVTKWSEKYRNKLYTKVIIVDMLNCATERLKYSEDLKGKYLHSNLIPRNDAFDVVIADERVCGTEKCRISYDKSGKRIGLPKPFQTELNETHVIETVDGKGNESFYILGFDKGRESLILSHLGPSGVETQLTKISHNKNYHLPSSNAIGKYGLCYEIDDSDEVRCLQYDAHANVKLNSTMNLGRNYTLLGVHNLVDDGLMLVSSSCQKINEVNLLSCKNFVITRVRENGKWQTFALVSNEFKCQLQSAGDSQSYVRENDTEDCVYLHSLYKQNIDDSNEMEFGYNLNSVCFPKRLIQRITSPV